MRSRSLPLSLLILTACAGADGPRPLPLAEPAPSATAPTEDRCATFSAALDEGKQLADAGNIERASRILARASSECAARSGEAAPLLLALLTELGRWDEAENLARAMLADARLGPTAQQALDRIAKSKRVFPDTDEAKADMRRLVAEAERAAGAGDHARAKAKYVEAWAAWHPNGEALLGAGRAARALGQPAESRRFFDRAIADFEKATSGTLRLDLPNGFSGERARAQWGRDPRVVFVSHGPSIDVLDAATWRSRASMKIEDGWVSAFAASDDGKWIAAVSSLGGRVRLFDAQTGNVAFDFEGRVGPLGALAFSPDGSLLLGGDDRMVHVWSVAERKEIRSIEVRNAVKQIVFARDGASFAVAYGVTAELFATRSLASIKAVYTPFPPDPHEHEYAPHRPKPPRAVAAIALSADAKTLAVASEDRNVYLFAMPTGRMTATLSIDCASLFGGACGSYGFAPTSLSLAPDGRWIVAGGFHGEIVRWDLPSKAQAWAKPIYSARVESISFRPDGRGFVSASEQGDVSFHEPTGESTRAATMHVEEPTYLGFASTSRLLTATTTYPATVRAWGLSSDGPGLQTAVSSPPIPAVSVAFDEPHQTSAWVLGDGDVKIWKPFAPATAVRTLAAPKKPAKSWANWAIALSRDGATIATAADTLRVFRAADGKDRIPPVTVSGVQMMAFSLDGTRLGRLDADGLTMIPLADAAHAYKIDLLPPESARAFAFGPDDMGVIAAGHSRIHWRSMSATQMGATSVTLESSPSQVAFSPDGQMIAALANGSIVLVDTAAARITRTIALPSGRWLGGIAFSPDGRFIAARNVDGTHLFSTADGTLRLTLRAVRGRDAGYAFTEAGEIEIFGNAAELVACRIGPMTFPFEVCAHRFVVPHLAARVLGMK